jgi:hypothetical protein
MNRQPTEHGNSHPHESQGVPLARPLVSGQLKDEICTLLLEIATTPKNRELVSSLQIDDAQCIINYLDQVRLQLLTAFRVLDIPFIAPLKLQFTGLQAGTTPAVPVCKDYEVCASLSGIL